MSGLPADTSLADARTERVSVGLVACAATKLSRPAPARDLYASQLFRAASAYAAAAYDHWFVISARHFLVHPDEVLEPYDDTLKSMVLADRLWWGRMIELELRCGHGARTEGRAVWPVSMPRLQLGAWIMAAPDGVTRRADIWVHAGQLYADAITAAVRQPHPFDVHTPLAGLGIGQQLAWYARGGQPALF